MAESLEFSAPSVSPQHLALRGAVAEAGLQVDRLRDLLWLLNAHPRLVAHAQVFANVSRNLGSATFSSEGLEWAGDWKSEVASWAEITSWLWENTRSLRKILALSKDFHLDPLDAAADSDPEHPIMRKGMVRHSIVAAIWTTHHSSMAGAEPCSRAGQRYIELQGHVLASYFECRFRLGSREFYEEYTEKPERPVAPMRGFVISPGLREFSLPEYDCILEQIPSIASTKAFAETFCANEIPTESIHDPRTAARARRDLKCLRRYFSRFLKVLEGWSPPQATRRGWGGGGSRARRPGFVQYLTAPDVYVEEGSDQNPDPDLASPKGQNVYIDRDPLNDPLALEASGLSPIETLEFGFNLVSPEEFGARFIKIQQQRRAMEMRGQQLPFAYEVLTPQEAAHVWDVGGRLFRPFRDATNASDAQFAAASSGLVSKLCLAFGQSLESMLSSHVLWIGPEQPAHTLPEDDIDKPALIIRSPEPGRWDGAEFLGLRLPGIMPDYRAALSDELAEIDGPYAGSFVLPDLLGVGPDVIEFLGRRSNESGPAFGVRQKTVRSVLRDALERKSRERVTFEKIALYLPRQVIHLTGDQSLSWITFADQTRLNEPRLHYTRHRVTKIQATYRRAARHLGRVIGHRIPPSDPVEVAPLTPDTCVGARFVLPLKEVKEIVSALVSFLIHPRVDREDPAQIVEYHNHYLFYLVLCEVMETATRSPASPEDLFERWKSQVDQPGALHASLSDKTSLYHDKTRLILISPSLAQQFAHFQDHVDHLVQLPRLLLPWATGGNRLGPFFTLCLQGNRMSMEPAAQGWISEMLLSVSGYPIPSNFARATLRTELLDRECPAQAVDAYLGHANKGESPFGLYSTFDYYQWQETLTPFLGDLRKELGLRPIASRLLPFRARRKEEW
jgi:hypothetical protein